MTTNSKACNSAGALCDERPYTHAETLTLFIIRKRFGKARRGTAITKNYVSEWAKKDRKTGPNMAPTANMKERVDLSVLHLESIWLQNHCDQTGPDGDEGAVVVLMAWFMGGRTADILSRTVGDLNKAQDLLWMPSATAPGGRRQLLVPSEVTAYLRSRAKNKPADALLFPAHREAQSATSWLTEKHRQLGLISQITDGRV